jgi:hypothetical protein
MPPDLDKENIYMFDSLEDQIKAEDMEGSPKEKLMRYAVISAVAVVVVGAVFAAVSFLK